MSENANLEYDSGTSGRLKAGFFVLHIILLGTLIAATTVLETYHKSLILLAAILQTSAFSILMVIDFRLRGSIGEHLETVGRSTIVRKQITELFAMTDMLQAAEDHEDAGAILTATATRLLPGFSGALYVFNNSRDRLDLAKHWGADEQFGLSRSLLPGNCWALKRGKAHINDPESGGLCCTHHIGSAKTIEVPMMARGKIHGLLMLSCEDRDAFAEMMRDRRLARALADSLSLAIANIALRDKLRTQSLRDPLTGLYNRRYMEDALERYVSLAERNRNSTSVLVIDLDNFKKINDEHGHAKGDAILRDVAAQLVAALRPSDVVSRYGGEELVVIMPDCDLEDAAHKAEMLRGRIEGLSEAHGFTVSASFGVATVPETAKTATEVIPIADAALYCAKERGKNCVVKADRRASVNAHDNPEGTAPANGQPRLAVG